MATKRKHVLPFVRKRLNKTDYKVRLNLLKSGLPRLVVRKTNTQIIGQIVDFDFKGDKVLFSVSSNDLRKESWKYSCSNKNAAYLLGVILAKKARSKKFDKELILDLGVQHPHKKGKIFAFVKGVIDARVNVKVGKEVLPNDKELSGKAVQNYYANKKNNQFSKIDYSSFVGDFDKLKKKLLS